MTSASAEKPKYGELSFYEINLNIHFLKRNLVAMMAPGLKFGKKLSSLFSNLESVAILYLFSPTKITYQNIYN